MTIKSWEETTHNLGHDIISRTRLFTLCPRGQCTNLRSPGMMSDYTDYTNKTSHSSPAGEYKDKDTCTIHAITTSQTGSTLES